MLHTKNMESPSLSFKISSLSFDKFFAMGPLYSPFWYVIYPNPASPSSLAQSFSLSKKLLGLSPIFVI